MINFDRRIFSTICRTFARYRDPSSDFDRVFTSTLRVASTFREHSNSLVLQDRLVTEHTFRSFALPAATVAIGSKRRLIFESRLEIPRNRHMATDESHSLAGSLADVAPRQPRPFQDIETIPEDFLGFQEISGFKQKTSFPALAFNERFTALTGRSAIRAGWEIYAEVGKSSTFLMTSALDLRSLLYFSLCRYACSLNHDHPIIWTFFTFFRKNQRHERILRHSSSSIKDQTVENLVK